jgi:hypothetical protein
MAPELTETIGKAFTATELTAVLMQPLLSPVTVYELEAVGATTEVPLEYVYVVAPLGTIVNDWPAQTVPDVTVILVLAHEFK